MLCDRTPCSTRRPGVLRTFWLALPLVITGCGAPAVSQQSFPVSSFPLAQGKEWTYAVCDAQGSCDDTISIAVVGYSSALSNEETSIWRLRSARGGMPRFIFDAETVFVARSVNTVIVQQQNQCYPYLSLNFPLVPGQWWRGRDPTVFDSVVVVSWDSLTVPIGNFPAALRIEEYRASLDSALVRQIWIVPQVGIVKMQGSSGLGAGPSRTWALVSFKP